MKTVLTLTSVFQTFILERGTLNLIAMLNVTGTEHGIGDQMAPDRNMRQTSTL